MSAETTGQDNRPQHHPNILDIRRADDDADGEVDGKVTSAISFSPASIAR